jgi:ACS family D-galactonate transporter-like MFS transporter
LSSSAVSAPATRPLSRLWNRELTRFPSERQRYVSLGIVVLTTIVLYYQLYLSGGVATDVIRDLHMSFVYYVNISVVGYLLGAGAAFLAGLADRYGRANIVTVGLALTGLLCAFVLPNVDTKFEFGAVYVAIGFVEGIVLVATPALVRDFSPQLGRASAMGFWTLGPVLGSLVVSVVVSTSSSTSTWQHQYLISGIIGLVVFAIALVGLRELSPRLRDQLMVSSKDRALIEARAKGLDLGEALRHPFRQMLKLDILGSAFAISVFLITYYVAVGFFPVFFETIFGYSQSKANGLGNWFWAFNAAALLVVGFLSDLVRVRKPFMVLGAVGAIIFTTLFALRATHPDTSHTTFVILLSLIAVSLGTAFAPWMASFTETVERRNPALIATGLAVWGLIIRIVIAVSIFFVPKVVTTVTPLVEKGPVVEGVLSDPTPVGQTTVGQVATAAADNPQVTAKLKVIQGRDAALLAALQANPTVAEKLAAGEAAGKTPTPAEAAAIEAAIGPEAFAQLQQPTTPADLNYVANVAPEKLGAANFAALSAPTPALTEALATLEADGPAVQEAAADSAEQWRTYFFVGVGGEVVFIPLILLMAGFWDPRKAKRAEQEHEAMVAAELERLQAEPTGPGAHGAIST